MFKVLTLAAASAAAIVSANRHLTGKPYDPACGYAPLCGTAADYSALAPTVGVPTTLEMNPCCTLADTVPVKEEQCDIVDPTGDAERVVGTSDAICDDDRCGDDCENDILVIYPNFESSERTECCPSCTCYGDPECIAFDGTRKLWLLCDGRTPPEKKKGHDRCLITKEGCAGQLDSFGNECKWIGGNSNGKSWMVGKKGSPCIPDPTSPDSEINMYSYDSYKMLITQGERGIITKVSLTTSCGRFNMTSEICLSKDQPWTIEGVDGNKDLPDFFKRTEVVDSSDVFWSINDPETGIAAKIRCYGNMYDGDDTIYVPRINVEDLSDPEYDQREGSDTDGFCKTAKFEYGKATYQKAVNIEEDELCNAGHLPQQQLPIYRAMCENPGLPLANVPNCRQEFCSKYWRGGSFDDMETCVQNVTENPRDGFCEALNANPKDVQECVDTWNQMGYEVTINKYLTPNQEPQKCITDINELPVSLDTCEEGATLQAYVNDEWVDVVSFPESVVCKGTKYEVTRCDEKFEKVFENRFRMIQETNEVSCTPTTKCTPTDGINFEFEFNTPTKEPTPAPTPFPSCPDTDLPEGYFNINDNNEPNLCSSEVTVNNLNGQGPVGSLDDLTKVIRFEDAGKLDGNKRDLLVQNSVQNYVAFDSQINGKAISPVDNCNYGAVSVRCDSTVDLEFTVRKNAEKEEFITDLSFFDICETNDYSVEYRVCESNAFYPIEFASSDLDISIENGCYVIKSKSKCVDVEGGRDLPIKPDQYTPEQEEKIIQASFVDKEVVSVQVTVKSNKQDCGHTVYFAGYSLVCAAAEDNPTPTPVGPPTLPPNDWPKNEQMK